MVQPLQVSNQIPTKRRIMILTLEHRAETETVLREKRRPKRSLRECFLLGGNSTCRSHIASNHFEEYEKRCKNTIPSIKPNFRCIPQDVVKAAKNAKGGQQGTLTFPKVKGPTEFTREAIVEAVMKLIACDDQVCFKLEVRF